MWNIEISNFAPLAPGLNLFFQFTQTLQFLVLWVASNFWGVSAIEFIIYIYLFVILMMSKKFYKDLEVINTNILK